MYVLLVPPPSVQNFTPYHSTMARFPLNYVPYMLQLLGGIDIFEK